MLCLKGLSSLSKTHAQESLRGKETRYSRILPVLAKNFDLGGGEPLSFARMVVFANFLTHNDRRESRVVTFRSKFPKGLDLKGRIACFRKRIFQLRDGQTGVKVTVDMDLE